MNIGIHFFDALMWLYGPIQHNELHLTGPSRMSGLMELEHARVRWFLSVDVNDLPEAVRQRGGFAFRSLAIDGEELDLTDGFTDLHTAVYHDVLGGGGFGIDDSRPAIELVHRIRTMPASPSIANAHPMLAGSPGGGTR
jgi:UDP-N-acetyl-2-amino-2-deoxyglucuronate dehydrogenase